MRLSGWLQTSSKWFVTGRQRTSTRFKFTSPVSKSFATANSDGSLSKQTIYFFKYDFYAKLSIDKDNLLCLSKQLLGLPAIAGVTHRSNDVEQHHLNIGSIQRACLTLKKGRVNRPKLQPYLAPVLPSLVPSMAVTILKSLRSMVSSQESKPNAEHNE